MEDPPPKKKQRSAVLAKDTHQTTKALGLAGLPSGAIQQIVYFQSHKDRASLRLTCVSFHDEVETYCKDSVARLKKKHRVDDSFDDRIRDQTGLETTRTKPLLLPYFYVLWRAMKTYLYKLESPEVGGGSYTIRSLQLSATGDRIATIAPVGQNHNLRFWDLNSKQLLPVIHGRDNLYPYRVFLVGELAVFCYRDGTIQVWSQTDGSLVGDYHSDNFRYAITDDLAGWKQYKGMLFFYYVDRNIHTFDALTGTFRMNLPFFDPPVEEGEERPKVRTAIAECGWFVVLVHKYGDEAEIRVFDLDDCSKKHVFRGAQYRNCSRLMPYPQSGSKKLLFFRYYGESNPEVLDLTDGSLSRHRYSLPATSLDFVHVTPQQFLALDKTVEGKSTIYNVETGGKERVLEHRSTTAYRCVVSESREEVYLGLRGGPTIAAYCLSEP